MLLMVLVTFYIESPSIQKAHFVVFLRWCDGAYNLKTVDFRKILSGVLNFANLDLTRIALLLPMHFVAVFSI